jgi:superfamily II DNA or RNA helicase
MLDKVNWSSSRVYRSGTHNEPMEFYLEGLSNSDSLDLLLGYFSSSAIRLLSEGFAKFIYNGGVLRLVINDVLSEKDLDALKIGENKEKLLKPYYLNDIQKLKSTLNDYGYHFFECISYLISIDKIKFKVIRPKNGQGISHYKSGVFKSGNLEVGFNASCNFTSYGLVENLEKLDCSLGWEDDRSKRYIASENEYFNNIFDEKADFVEYVNTDQIKTAIRTEFGDKTLNELLDDERQMLSRKNEILNNPFLKKAIEKLDSDIVKIAEEELKPKFPFKQGPREYQLEAHRLWIANGKQGILAMATGTGKTLTSLNCLLNEYRSLNTYKAIILVPTIALVNQWVKECREFNFNNIITISSRSKWEEELSTLNLQEKFKDVSFIIIATYASFVKQKFQEHFRKLNSETLFIADEAHNLGSNNLSKLLKSVHLLKRIGLSATPNRKYDDLGNDNIDTFFNDKSPYIYSFSMSEAIESGFLCPYEYYPHIVELTNDEFDKYCDFSKRLMKYIDSKTGKYKDCEEVEILLLERKRIVHKAENKILIFGDVLKNEFYKRAGDLRYTLIYVPEGKEEDNLNDDDPNCDVEDIKLINNYTIKVSDLGVTVKQFTSTSKDRDDDLKKFQNGEIQVLTSMKCLDEGVDVPRSELAIFCSSSGNPRQFIQRRGRVLRKHPDKKFAVIHDLIVAPKIERNDPNYSFARNLVLGEFERVIDFANLALNRYEAQKSLESMLELYDLSLYQNG